MSTESDELARLRAIDAVAALQAKARHGPGVHMDGSHNPLPSEETKARMFAEDHIDPLLSRQHELEARLADAEQLVDQSKRGLLQDLERAHDRAARYEKALREMAMTAELMRYWPPLGHMSDSAQAALDTRNAIVKLGMELSEIARTALADAPEPSRCPTCHMRRGVEVVYAVPRQTPCTDPWHEADRAKDTADTEEASE